MTNGLSNPWKHPAEAAMPDPRKSAGLPGVPLREGRRTTGRPGASAVGGL